MIQKWHEKTYHKTKGFLFVHWKRVLVIGGLAGILIVTFAQVIYPSDKLLPYQTVDNLSFGGWIKTEATKSLDERYAAQPIDIYFGNKDASYRSPTPAAIGLVTSNEQRIASMKYPWYLRLAPGSLLWGHLAISPNKPLDYERQSDTLAAYIKQELGESCQVPAVNATLKLDDKKLSVIKSKLGGSCTLADVTKTLGTVKMQLVEPVEVIVPVTAIPAIVSDADARAMASMISDRIGDGISLRAGSETVMLPRDQLFGWLDFTTEGDVLDYTFNVERASETMTTAVAPKVASAAGVTKVSTYDFVETSRQNGVGGQTLDVEKTVASLKSYVASEIEQANAITAAVAPRIEYVRSYSPTHVGLSALIQNYAESHPGTYGVVLTELSGQYRRATYAGTKSFTTASTYKLFVAYGTLKRVEAGTWQWSDQIQGGRDLAKCFDDMIVVSDNACAETLLKKLGYTALTKELRAAGFANTSFEGNDGIKTTPEDLALMLSMLQTSQILDQQASRDRLIGAMKRNIYRQGIPKGINAVVANKVGFLDRWLHDAGIVYAPSGPYVLVIMTESASWANIADLTRQIEALRIQ